MDAEECIKVIINPFMPDRDLSLCHNEQNFSWCLHRLNLDTPKKKKKNFSKGHFPVAFFGVRHGDVETEGSIYAGGFCFGRKWQCPTKNNRKTNNVHYFQNQHLHFTFCCSSLAVEEASGETNITIVDDDRKPCVNDFVPNEEIMDNLFKCLLDRLPKFEEEHKEVVTQSNKRQKKILEGEGVL